MNSSPHISVVLLRTDPLLDNLAVRLGDNFVDIDVAAIFADWEQLAASPLLANSIVLLDAELKSPAATVDLIRGIRSANARVITLSGVDTPNVVVRFMAAGAEAALRKSDSSRRVVDQLRLSANRDRLIREAARP